MICRYTPDILFLTYLVPTFFHFRSILSTTSVREKIIAEKKYSRFLTERFMEQNELVRHKFESRKKKVKMFSLLNLFVRFHVLLLKYLSSLSSFPPSPSLSLFLILRF